MQTEYLQIRRQSIESILEGMHPIDPDSDVSTRLRAKKFNAFVIAGAITGILRDIDSDLAREFAFALGLGKKRKKPQTTQVPA